ERGPRHGGDMPENRRIAAEEQSDGFSWPIDFDLGMAGGRSLRWTAIEGAGGGDANGMHFVCWYRINRRIRAQGEMTTSGQAGSAFAIDGACGQSVGPGVGGRPTRL